MENKMKSFILNKGFPLPDELQANPHIVLQLPGEEKLVAVALQQEDYPAIDIYLCGQEKEPELICFAEYNRERTSQQEVCVGTYPVSYTHLFFCLTQKNEIRSTIF